MIENTELPPFNYLYGSGDNEEKKPGIPLFPFSLRKKSCSVPRLWSCLCLCHKFDILCGNGVGNKCVCWKACEQNAKKTSSCGFNIEDADHHMSKIMKCECRAVAEKFAQKERFLPSPSSQAKIKDHLKLCEFEIYRQNFYAKMIASERKQAEISFPLRSSRNNTLEPTAVLYTVPVAKKERREKRKINARRLKRRWDFCREKK